LSKARLPGEVENLYHHLSGVAARNQPEADFKIKVESLPKGKNSSSNNMYFQLQKIC
jgi:hypothetical protein